MTQEIDQLARLWEKTKDPKYKALWYKLVKEYADGINNSKRRFISSSTSNKTDDGRNKIT
jgi:hypothetical protein